MRIACAVLASSRRVSRGRLTWRPWGEGTDVGSGKAQTARRAGGGPGGGRGGARGGSAGLRAGGAAVRLRRPLRDAEPPCDLLVRAALRDELDDLPLPLREPDPALESSHGRDPRSSPAARQSIGWRIFGITPFGVEGT